jgi:hypothetical protein
MQRIMCRFLDSGPNVTIRLINFHRMLKRLGSFLYADSGIVTTRYPSIPTF